MLRLNNLKVVRLNSKKRQYRLGWGGMGFILVSALFSSGLAQAAATQDQINRFNLLRKIDKGFFLFTHETFKGNGRTCSTCHIPSEHYDIFPSTLKKLSTAQMSLVLATNVPGLENIDLIKSRTLFNTSGSALAYGADQPALFGTASSSPVPVFRSSLGIQALDLTSTNTSSNFPGSPSMPSECSAGTAAGKLRQLGWSGNGAPGSSLDLDGPIPGVSNDLCHTNHGDFDALADGSIRAFINGAIAQHNTRTLNRVPGVLNSDGSLSPSNADFRFSTVSEADAITTFMKWLGRRPLTAEENTAQGTTGRIEFDITRLNFFDDRLDLGRRHYVAPPEFIRNSDSTGKLVSVSGPNPNSGADCNNCHTNGGAAEGIPGVSGGLVSAANRGQNVNENTNVEAGSDAIAVQLFGSGSVLPLDQGASDSNGSRPPAPTFDGAFNVQSIIEAPRKGAWYHNHRVLNNFEKSIEFYITTDFWRTDHPEGPFTTDVGSTTNVAPAFTSEKVMRFGNASKSLGTISFPNGDGIEHLGAFLRGLSAFYSLRDCERLVDEMVERIDLGIAVGTKLPLDLPMNHCKFALLDVKLVINGAKIAAPITEPGLLTLVDSILNNLLNGVAPLVKNNNLVDAKNLLITTKSDLQSARAKIATVTSTPS